MSDLTEELLELKSNLEDAQEKINKAKGAYEQILKQIKDEFGYKTLKEALELLEELNSKNEKLKKAAEEELKKFKEKWEDVINIEEENDDLL